VLARRVHGEWIASTRRVDADAIEQRKVDRKDRGVQHVRSFTLARWMSENWRSQSDRPFVQVKGAIVLPRKPGLQDRTVQHVAARRVTGLGPPQKT